MYFIGGDGYQNLLVFHLMLSSLILLTECQLEEHLKKLNHLILTLNRFMSNLANGRVLKVQQRCFNEKYFFFIAFH